VPRSVPYADPGDKGLRVPGRRMPGRGMPGAPPARPPPYWIVTRSPFVVVSPAALAAASTTIP
jgi:hypothetical protein